MGESNQGIDETKRCTWTRFEWLEGVDRETQGTGLTKTVGNKNRIDMTRKKEHRKNLTKHGKKQKTKSTKTHSSCTKMNFTIVSLKVQ